MQLTFAESSQGSFLREKTTTLLRKVATRELNDCPLITGSVKCILLHEMISKDHLNSPH